MARYYEELEHTADWTIRVWGASLDRLFANAAGAMFEMQGADLAAQPVHNHWVHCRAGDLEALLIAWLNELLFLSETQNALYTRFQVRIEPARRGFELEADVRGLAGRGPLAHIKAVTYWDLAVRPTDSGWEATVTFDT
jgi:SHS2 domain-containing protein